jgi:hypothetical protein
MQIRRMPAWTRGRPPGAASAAMVLIPGRSLHAPTPHAGWGQHIMGKRSGQHEAQGPDHARLAFFGKKTLGSTSRHAIAGSGAQGVATGSRCRHMAPPCQGTGPFW